MSRIEFTDNENNTVEYDVIEATVLGGNTYILVADAEDNALILKEQFSPEDEETTEYTDALTDSEYDAVAAVFSQLLEDEDIALEMK